MRHTNIIVDVQFIAFKLSPNKDFRPGTGKQDGEKAYQIPIETKGFLDSHEIKRDSSFGVRDSK